MKKFRLIGAVCIENSHNVCSAINIVEADTYDEVILDLEREGGWFRGKSRAFKPILIEEVEE